jgi:predicted DNA-binding protein
MLIYIMKRTQIYLDEEQDRRLAKRSRTTGRTKSEIIREALQRFLSREPQTSDLELNLKRTAGALPEIEAPDRDEWNDIL